nr:MYXO-CTERM sorting domain-containing protein [Archangium primigenium]
MSVELSNTTDCDVSEVIHVERLRGLSYVQGSAKFDGQPLAKVTWKEASGELIVEALALPQQGTGRLTYVARPHLVGERLSSGETSLRGEIISLADAPVQPPAEGCGCSSPASGPMLFALAALAGATRRRRPATARS